MQQGACSLGARLDFVAEDVALFPILNLTQSYQEGEMLTLHRCLAILQYFDLTHGSEERRAMYLELPLC